MRAWLLLLAALTLPVADEAAHDFLAAYNPAVLRIREWWNWASFPTFDFAWWLAGLIAAILLTGRPQAPCVASAGGTGPPLG